MHPIRGELFDRFFPADVESMGRAMLTNLRRTDDVAALIKARREALGLSQQALADRLTVSRKWVNEIERGNSNAKLVACTS